MSEKYSRGQVVGCQRFIGYTKDGGQIWIYNQPDFGKPISVNWGEIYDRMLSRKDESIQARRDSQRVEDLKLKAAILREEFEQKQKRRHDPNFPARLPTNFELFIERCKSTQKLTNADRPFIRSALLKGYKVEYNEDNSRFLIKPQ